MTKYLIPALAFSCTLACAKDELRFTSQAVEVKVAPDQDVITVSFPFKNASGKSVKLGKIHSSCDCTNAAYMGSKTVLAPGEQSSVEASMKTGTFSGVVEKELIVKAEGSDYKLTIKAVIPEIVKISPRKLEWTQGEAPNPKEMIIRIDPGHGLKLTDVSLVGKDFNYEPVTVKAGREYKVIVTPKTTDKAAFNSIWILTDSTIPRYSRFLGFLAINSKK